MALYHVSPTKNNGSILWSGIEPLFAAGKEQKVWLVDRARLLWAIAHCSARHHIAVHELTIWECPDVISKLQKTKWKGVFSTECRIRPVTYMSAVKFVEIPREQNSRLSDAEPPLYGWNK